MQEHRWQTSEETSISYGTLKNEIWRFEYCSVTPEGQQGSDCL